MNTAASSLDPLMQELVVVPEGGPQAKYSTLTTARIEEIRRSVTTPAKVEPPTSPASADTSIVC